MGKGEKKPYRLIWAISRRAKINRAGDLRIEKEKSVFEGGGGKETAVYSSKIEKTAVKGPGEGRFRSLSRPYKRGRGHDDRFSRGES